jgi:hypothetical protein
MDAVLGLYMTYFTYCVLRTESQVHSVLSQLVVQYVFVRHIRIPAASKLKPRLRYSNRGREIDRETEGTMPYAPAGHLPSTDSAHQAPFIIPPFEDGIIQSPKVRVRFGSFGFHAQNEH